MMFPRFFSILLAVIAAVSLPACGKTEARATDPVQSNFQWERVGPDELGVVCYRFASRDGISCVRVKP